MNLGVYPESDPENIAYPNLLTVECPFRILDIKRLQKSTMKLSYGGVGGARGAYLAHGLKRAGLVPGMIICLQNLTLGCHRILIKLLSYFTSVCLSITVPGNPLQTQ